MLFLVMRGGSTQRPYTAAVLTAAIVRTYYLWQYFFEDGGQNSTEKSKEW